MSFFNRLFAWWDGYTIGTMVTTWRKGVEVGEDEFGNTYYRNDDSSRRWVIYKGVADASKISPDWHGWLHHTFEAPPTREPLERKDWERDHIPNLTGTDAAYQPAGSIRDGKAPASRRGYEAWSPQ